MHRSAIHGVSQFVITKLSIYARKGNSLQIICLPLRLQRGQQRADAMTPEEKKACIDAISEKIIALGAKAVKVC